MQQTHKRDAVSARTVSLLVSIALTLLPLTARAPADLYAQANLP